MRTGVKDKEDIIPRLFKLHIAPAFALLIATFHFNKAVHLFANILGVSRIGNLRSIFKKGVIVAHLTQKAYSQFEKCIRCVKAIGEDQRNRKSRFPPEP
jgi:hypothetical protein